MGNARDGKHDLLTMSIFNVHSNAEILFSRLIFLNLEVGAELELNTEMSTKNLRQWLRANALFVSSLGRNETQEMK